jgi:hypothetical protein
LLSTPAGIYLSQAAAAAPLRTASHDDSGTTAPHDGNRQAAAGSATAAGAEVTVNDINCSDDCPYTSHHGNHTEAAATAAAAADAGASADDGIDSEGRPEGRLSAWRPEAANDGIYSEGCPEGRPSGWGPEVLRRSFRSNSGKNAAAKRSNERNHKG